MNLKTAVDRDQACASPGVALHRPFNCRFQVEALPELADDLVPTVICRLIMKRLVAITLLLFTACATSGAVVGELPDPTRPLGGRTVAPAPTPAPVHVPASVLQSILVSPQRRLAVISGRTVSVGDHVGDAVVVEILPYEVVLQRSGQEVRMRLMSRLNKQAVNRTKEQ